MNAAVPSAPERFLACMETSPRLSDKLTCREALRTINGYPEADYFLVCDRSGKPLGYLEKHQFMLSLSGRLGLDLYYSKPVRQLMKSLPLPLNAAI
ncbi:CBS domain-containing protein [Cohnella fermenti]|uniref:CBS domain-containing protein n=1 Tax=Cohnella fermenti TaxID=2565925 RepID=A0A4S4BLR5_9BACL|nr:hypothetical protein [Cohnella fermenti]THF75147.1 hypothetical protein E6C55_22965 [Cohnella fermenti]